MGNNLEAWSVVVVSVSFAVRRGIPLKRKIAPEVLYLPGFYGCVKILAWATGSAVERRPDKTKVHGSTPW